jgi:hypothetical protein
MFLTQLVKEGAFMGGGIVLLGGIAAVIFGFLIGARVQHSVMDVMRRGAPGETMKKMQSVRPVAAVATLLFYGGGLAVVIGIVLMVVSPR